MATHSYAAHVLWKGSTGGGYRSYSRDHTAVSPPASAAIDLSSDPHFRGSAERTNPEQLLVMAASSCQWLSFLALAARDGVDVLDYEDDATGTMDDRDLPARINEIVLAPTIRVAPGTDHEKVRQLSDLAHEQCYIANSLTTRVRLEVTVLDAVEVPK